MFLDQPYSHPATPTEFLDVKAEEELRQLIEQVPEVLHYWHKGKLAAIREGQYVPNFKALCGEPWGIEIQHRGVVEPYSTKGKTMAVCEKCAHAFNRLRD